jgi:Beta-lactamase enzyme family
MNPQTLAEALRQAVLGLPWYSVIDRATNTPLLAPPSIDLAVVAFPPKAAPVAANVLFSREHPQGHVAAIAPSYGPVQGVRFVADVRDAESRSFAWAPGADWQAISFPPLRGDTGPRFVAPYPASLIKLMVVVAVARLVDAARCEWHTEQLGPTGVVMPLHAWCEAMITRSDNDATDACVAALHRFGAIAPPHHHELHALFAALHLPTLRLAGTTAAGGWRNGVGSGVGQLQMTAWDSARLLWWLDTQAPPPPWLGPQSPTLQMSSRERILGWLADQRLNEILSSGSLRALPGWMPGLPEGEVSFAHKTGNTENYASDAGIVRGLGGRRRHYIVALLTNLGQRYAPHPQAAAPWCLPMLGARVDALMARWLDA